MLAFNVIFNVSDLVTSSVALGNGLLEGNSLVLGLAGATGLETIGALVLMKVVFLAFVASVFLLGVKVRSRQVKILAFESLLASTMVFFVVSMNNLYWILH